MSRNPFVLLLSLWLCTAAAIAAPPLANVLTPLDNPGMPAGLIFENLSKPFLLWVELDAGKLHLLQRLQQGTYVKRSTRPVSIGKNGTGKLVEGDLKTPIGVYQITSFIDDQKLDDFYGAGAYPMNFPNAWDRLSRRSGHGIWLHGLPKGVDSRPLLDSEGCVIIDNPSIEAMAEFVIRGESLIVLSPSLDWLPPASEQPATDILAVIELWRQSWEANKHEDYVANYGQDFSDGKRDLAAWSTYKKHVNRYKRDIRVTLSQMSVIKYPGEENLVTVRFFQDYASNNFEWRGWKQLLWRRDAGGTWRIFYEGNG